MGLDRWCSWFEGGHKCPLLLFAVEEEEREGSAMHDWWNKFLRLSHSLRDQTSFYMSASRLSNRSGNIAAILPISCTKCTVTGSSTTLQIFSLLFARSRTFYWRLSCIGFSKLYDASLNEHMPPKVRSAFWGWICCSILNWVDESSPYGIERGNKVWWKTVSAGMSIHK